MSVLFNIYQAYYILAGVAGLTLYPWVARMSYERLQSYIASPDKSTHTTNLLVGVLVLIACSAEVQFCFARAAMLIRMAL